MSDLFDSEFLKRLEYLSLVAKRIARGDLRAERLTRVRGAGVEFADYREYSAGDDFRYVDWNAYARLGDLLLKMFEEEQDLHVYFLLDASRSMTTGEPPKLLVGKQLVAALAYITLSNLDRAGISFFGPGLVREEPVARGKGRIRTLLKLLERAEPAPGETSLVRTVEQFLHRRRRRGIVVLVSDLFDREFREALDRLRYSRHQLFVIQLLADADRYPRTMGDLDLVDVETGQVKSVTVTERALAAYRRSFDRFLDAVRSYGTQFEVPVAQASTSLDLERIVLDLFRRGGLVR